MLNDETIIALYEQRDEQAITATKQKYGALCRSIAWRILHNAEDVEECLNDTWLRIWNAIPPAHPESLPAFLSTVIRRLCFDRYEAHHADKRGGGEIAVALEELHECVASTENVAAAIEQKEIIAALNRFLETLSEDARTIFMQRYGNLCTTKEIAAQYRISESKVKVTLFRVRKRLQAYLRKEGLL